MGSHFLLFIVIYYTLDIAFGDVSGIGDIANSDRKIADKVVTYHEFEFMVIGVSHQTLYLEGVSGVLNFSARVSIAILGVGRYFVPTDNKYLGKCEGPVGIYAKLKEPNQATL